jgi:hypothetical protein
MRLPGTAIGPGLCVSLGTSASGKRPRKRQVSPLFAMRLSAEERARLERNAGKPRWRPISSCGY